MSAKEALTKLNSNIEIIPYKIQLDSSNALDIIKDYDVVLDCTDNVATRYLLNDACVMTKKPLVSGSALQLEGQLTVYNHNKGPCYRCIFPTPPPPETVVSIFKANGIFWILIHYLNILDKLRWWRSYRSYNWGNWSIAITWSNQNNFKSRRSSFTEVITFRWKWMPFQKYKTSWTKSKLWCLWRWAKYNKTYGLRNVLSNESYR